MYCITPDPKWAKIQDPVPNTLKFGSGSCQVVFFFLLISSGFPAAIVKTASPQRGAKRSDSVLFVAGGHLLVPEDERLTQETFQR